MWLAKIFWRQEYDYVNTSLFKEHYSTKPSKWLHQFKAKLTYSKTTKTTMEKRSITEENHRGYSKCSSCLWQRWGKVSMAIFEEGLCIKIASTLLWSPQNTEIVGQGLVEKTTVLSIWQEPEVIQITLKNSSKSNSKRRLTSELKYSNWSASAQALCAVGDFRKAIQLE